MKHKRLYIAIIIALITLQVNAQSNTKDWITYSIPNACTFKIPPTMEVRSDESLHSRFIKAVHQSGLYEMLCDNCDLYFDEATIIIQSKGLNSDPGTDAYKAAADSYARILMKFSYSDFTQDDVVGLKPSELMELDTMWRNEAKQGIDCLSDYFTNVTGTFKWFPLRLETYSGTTALVTEYNRQGTGGETRVREYKFFFNKKFLRITTSYKLSEEAKYKDDFRSFMKLLNIITTEKI